MEYHIKNKFIETTKNNIVLNKEDIKLDPPEGYKDPYKYERNRLAVLQILIVTFFLPVIVFLPTFYELFFVFLGDNLTILILIFISSVIVNTYIHELIHAIVMRSLGDKPEIKFERKNILPQPKAVSTDKFVDAKKHIKTLLAPLIIIDITTIIIILLDINNLLTYFSILVLWLNTTGSCNDIYDTYRFHILPDNTLIYTPKENTETSYLTEPKK